VQNRLKDMFVLISISDDWKSLALHANPNANRFLLSSNCRIG
jgi:hypothetical protein